MSSYDPIIACSSGGENNCAITLLRIGGFSDVENFQKYFSKNLSNLVPRYATFTKLTDGERTLDEVVITLFKAPMSYNGENILEIAVHGNKINTQNILSLFINSGLVRMANPGEFTLRAVKNKKMTLSQAEGLDLLLNSNSSFGLQEGLSVLNGEMKREFDTLRSSCLEVQSSLEIMMDFSDDVGDEQVTALFEKNFSGLKKKIYPLIQRAKLDSSKFISPRICLIGNVNAGKSTIFNLLLGKSRSIVSDIKGTTRDYLTERISLNGSEFEIVDTAGVRVTSDQIESEGIKRAKKIYEDSFFKVQVLDRREFSSEKINQNSDLIIFTHCDLVDEFFIQNIGKMAVFLGHNNQKSSVIMGLCVEPGPIGPEKKSGGPIGPNQDRGPIGPGKKLGGPIGPNQESGPIGPSNNSGGPIGPIEIISGPIGPDSSQVVNFIDFFEEIVSRKYETFMKKKPISIRRHRETLLDINIELERFSQLINDGVFDLGIFLSEFNIIARKIDELVGISSSEEVLDHIFSNFCIGK